MAIASSRITRQAPNKVITTPKYVRPKPTVKQRELRTQRGNIKVAASEKRQTISHAAGEQKQLRKFSQTITQENERFRTGQSGVRIQQREAAILHRYREGIGIRRSERLQRNLIEEPVVNSIKPASNSIILVIVVSFMLIIFYAIVTHSQGFSGFLSGIGNTIATISQTGPLFTKSQS